MTQEIETKLDEMNAKIDRLINFIDMVQELAGPMVAAQPVKPW